MDNLDELNSSISKAFNTLITNLTDEKFDSNAIERQFNDLSNQITDVEGVSYPHYVEHRHRYHTIHLAYYQKLKDQKKIETEQRLVLKYASLRTQYLITETPVQTDEISNDETYSDSEQSWESIFNLVTSLSQLQDTNQIIDTLKRIRSVLTAVFRHDVRTFDQYFLFQSNCKDILSLFETLKINEIDATLDKDNDEKPNYLDLLTEIIDFVSNGLEDRQVYFANILLSDLPHLDEILFANIPETEKSITQRYREWARMFHSDKHGANPSFDELMKQINYFRDRHLLKIQSLSARSGIVNNELDKGHKHSELSIAFKKRLKSGGDQELSIEQLEKLISFEALTAFEHYRAALKSLGKMTHEPSDILHRAQILEWMALMMRQSGNHDIEAQLYIVAAIYIITDSNMTEQSYQKLRALQKALEKYQGIAGNTSQEASAATPVNSNRELVLCTNSKSSPREIHDETKVLIRQTVLRKCVVRSSEPRELTVGLDSNFSTSTNPLLRVGGFIADKVPFLGSNLLIRSCSWMLNKLVFGQKNDASSAPDLSAEYKTRQKLNTLMGKAVIYYNDEQYAKFIEQLSMPYYQDQKLMDTKLGSQSISIEIRVDQIIQPLLKHGFRADKIAHLLILIGEVLLRGVDFDDLKRANPEHSALLEQSKILFQGVYDSTQLTEAAVKLDKRVEQYYQKKIRKIAQRILDPIPKEDIDGSREKPYNSRLAGCCRLARLNYAIACLLAGGKDNYERCKQSLRALKLSENTYQDRFFVIPDARIQALEDLLSAFGMDDEPPNSTNVTTVLPIEGSVTVDIKNIEYLKTQFGYHACKIVETVNDENDQLSMLARLVPSAHNFECEKFIQYLSEKYLNTDQLILGLLHEERVSNLSEWAIKFRSNRKVFHHRAYLPLLSAFGNMKIQPCDVTSDVEYGFVFATSHPVIDYTPGRNEVHDLFVVVRSGQAHISCVFNVEVIEISHLHWALKDLPENHPQRAVILLRIATFYMDEARRSDKQNHLAALIDWQKAQQYYIKILSMKESVTEECLESAEVGYFKCLLKQHRYSRINERLSTRNRISSGELWWIYAQAQRHIGDYDGAKFGVRQAMRLQPFNMDIQREEKTIRMKQERIQVYEPLDFSSCFSIRSGETPFYNILSIDGGGIRGVIPAIWLMLLEHKIKKPISSIFHVVAGTSTGAIIGAGLTTPSLDSPSKPRYQARDLVELYRTKAEKVFARNSGFLNQLWTSILMEAKYSGDGRHNLFAEYFGGSKLSDALCELVVPAVKGDSNTTDVFTRHGSLQDITKNVLLTKMLMCTTAAPTYFPPYSLNDIVYIDGGVQANNPAMLAYDHTLKIYRNCNRNRIRLLSLGTGDYVSDPLNPDAGRNLLFWARNNQSVIKVLMDGPQNNIDLHLNNVLDENYYRWQIWLENPIELDDIKEASINRLIDLAHGHLEEMEAYDNRHRLGCLIESLQSSS